MYSLLEISYFLLFIVMRPRLISNNGKRRKASAVAKDVDGKENVESGNAVMLTVGNECIDSHR